MDDRIDHPRSYEVLLGVTYRNLVSAGTDPDDEDVRNHPMSLPRSAGVSRLDRGRPGVDPVGVRAGRLL